MGNPGKLKDDILPYSNGGLSIYMSFSFSIWYRQSVPFGTMRVLTNLF